MKLAISLITTLFLFGCIQGGVNFHTLLGIPTPVADQPIVSVENVKQNQNFNPLESQHSMQEELVNYERARAQCQKIYDRIKIGGASPQCPDFLRLVFTSSQRIKSNDYIIGCSKVFPMEVQKNNYYCWAAASQYLIMSKFNSKIPQKTIVEKAKKEIPKVDRDCAADIIDIVSALGFRGLTWTPSGSWQLLSTLAQDQPVMIGLNGDGVNEGHAVVVLSARYSFVDSATPGCLFCGKFAFSKFQIYDPADGKIHEVPASQLDGKISFVMSYFQPSDTSRSIFRQQ